MSDYSLDSAIQMIPQILTTVNSLKSEIAELKAARDPRLTKEFYTLRECCQIKGAGWSYSLLTKPGNEWRRPAFGQTVRVSGEMKGYSRDQVLHWLPKTEAEWWDEYQAWKGTQILENKFSRRVV